MVGEEKAELGRLLREGRSGQRTGRSEREGPDMEPSV